MVYVLLKWTSIEPCAFCFRPFLGQPVYLSELWMLAAKLLRFLRKEKVRLPMMKGLHNDFRLWRSTTTHKTISDCLSRPVVYIDLANFVRNCETSKNIKTTERKGLYGVEARHCLVSQVVDWYIRYVEERGSKKHVHLVLCCSIFGQISS